MPKLKSPYTMVREFRWYVYKKIYLPKGTVRDKIQEHSITLLKKFRTRAAARKYMKKLNDKILAHKATDEEINNAKTQRT